MPLRLIITPLTVFFLSVPLFGQSEENLQFETFYQDTGTPNSALEEFQKPVLFTDKQLGPFQDEHPDTRSDKATHSQTEVGSGQEFSKESEKKVIEAINEIDYEGDLKKPVEKFKSYYSVSDDKYNESEFNKNVDKQNQMQSKGIEVGHIFSFGTKYSTSMKANVLDFDGKEKSVYMGSYGIGISRLVGAIIETSHDEKGIIWPDVVAPFLFGIINLSPKDEIVSSNAEKIYNYISNKYETIYDDKKDNAGVKFSRMDLIGIPHQIIIGNKSKSDNEIEYKNRRTGNSEFINIDKIDELIKRFPS